MNREQTLKHAEEAAHHLLLAINSFVPDEAGKEIALEIFRGHPCLQENVFDAVIIPLVRKMGKRFDTDIGIDARNYQAGKWCSTVCHELDRLEAERKAEREWEESRRWAMEAAGCGEEECRANAAECGGF